MRAIIQYLLTLMSAEDSEGQGLVEYALLLILVAVVMVFILTVLAPGMGNIYSNIIAQL
jgi:pilus assembly protein Flp/PilA